MEKGPNAFRTISEVAEDLDLPQHVLRFWETKFSQIKPLKRGGGRRFYRPEDIDLLRGIRHLLYGEGYTIKGVQKILRSEGSRFVAAIGRGEAAVEPARRAPSGEAGNPEDNGEAGAFEEPEEEADRSLLSDEAAATLRAALDDLLECERLLCALDAQEHAQEPEPGR